MFRLKLFFRETSILISSVLIKLNVFKSLVRLEHLTFKTQWLSLILVKRNIPSTMLLTLEYVHKGVGRFLSLASRFHIAKRLPSVWGSWHHHINTSVALNVLEAHTTESHSLTSRVILLRVGPHYILGNSQQILVILSPAPFTAPDVNQLLMRFVTWRLFHLPYGMQLSNE